MATTVIYFYMKTYSGQNTLMSPNIADFKEPKSEPKFYIVSVAEGLDKGAISTIDGGRLCYQPTSYCTREKLISHKTCLRILSIILWKRSFT